MALLIVQVAVSGELIGALDLTVDSIEAHQMLSRANEDERSIKRIGQDLEGGEVWVDMIDEDGETLFDEVACFHRADAADALQLHFGVSAAVVKDCLSKSNPATLYAKHRTTTKAYFPKEDWLVDDATVVSRQSNRRRLGEASVMDLVMELSRRLESVETQLSLSELPISVRSAASHLNQAARGYVSAVEQIKS
jgi:hypothetical protein